MNNYEIKRLNEHDDPKEKYFEFKSEDVGKLTKINVSINQDDDPAAYLYIDFIEIKIPSKSEAYKYVLHSFIPYLLFISILNLYSHLISDFLPFEFLLIQKFCWEYCVIFNHYSV